MKGYHSNLSKTTTDNTNWRQVLYTGHNLQLVLQSIPVGQEVGSEVHDDRDQFFKFESGQGKVVIDETEYNIVAGDGVVVPQGAWHNVINTSDSQPLQFSTVYAKPENHKDLVMKTSDEEETHWDGQTTE